MKKVLLILLAALACGCLNNVSTYTATDYLAGFDTVFAYTETTASETLFNDHFKKARDMFTLYNDYFDIYNTYDDVISLMEVNENAGIRPVEVSGEIISLLEKAKAFYDLSGGKFDITMGAVFSLWHDYREEGISQNESGGLGLLPSEEELASLSNLRGWDQIEIDKDKSTVYIKTAGVSLDVGGIAKGYAAEMIGAALEEDGVSSAIINAGRNIRTIGTKKNGADWRVAIANPLDTTDADGIMVVSFNGPSSFVTSGDYERYFTAADGENYCHIIDPDTLYPANMYHSVTIITSDAGAADALSTILFTVDIEAGKEILSAYTALTGEKADAIWMMDPDKNQSQAGTSYKDLWIVYTEGLAGTITWN